jgi:hypothetical protein
MTITTHSRHKSAHRSPTNFAAHCAASAQPRMCALATTVMQPLWVCLDLVNHAHVSNGHCHLLGCGGVRVAASHLLVTVTGVVADMAVAVPAAGHKQRPAAAESTQLDTWFQQRGSSGTGLPNFTACRAPPSSACCGTVPHCQHSVLHMLVAQETVAMP